MHHGLEPPHRPTAMTAPGDRARIGVDYSPRFT
jgi:hypothetical protein